MPANEPESITGKPAVTEQQLKAAGKYIEEEEGAASRFTGLLGLFITAVLVVMSVFHLYAEVWIVPTQTPRPVHVGFLLFLTFLLFRLVRGFATD